jgi:hypothetical protein
MRQFLASTRPLLCCICLWLRSALVSKEVLNPGEFPGSSDAGVGEMEMMREGGRERREREFGRLTLAGEMFLVLAVLAVKSQASRLLPAWDDDAASTSSSSSLSMSNEKGSSTATGSCESPSADLDASSFAPPLSLPTSSEAPTALFKRLAPEEVLPYRFRGILQQPGHCVLRPNGILTSQPKKPAFPGTPSGQTGFPRCQSGEIRRKLCAHVPAPHL